MKALSRIVFLLASMGFLAIALSFVPRHPVVAAGPPATPVTVTNTPLPVQGTVAVSNFPATQAVTGSVNANITNSSLPVTGSVTTTITSNVPVVNPTNQSNNPVPLTIVTSDEALRTPVGSSCLANVSSASCTVYTVPAGSRLVIESLAVSIVRINNGIHPSQTFFLSQTNSLAFAEHLPLSQQGSDAYGDYLTGNVATRVYADPNSSVVCNISFDGPVAATNGVLKCELSGHLVPLP